MRCVFEWDECFKSGRTSLDDDTRSGRPSTSSTPDNIETIRQLVHEDRRRSIRDIAAGIVGVSYGTVQAILTSDLNMHHIAAKLVPRHLAFDQKELRAEIGQDLHQRALDDPTSMSRGSSLGTRLGSTGTTRRPTNRLRSGRAQHLHDRRRQDMSTARPRACSSFSSTFVRLFTVNSSPCVRPSNATSPAMF